MSPPRKHLADKKGQGSLIAVALAGAIGALLVGSVTQWYLSMNQHMNGTNDRLEAMTIAMSEWQRLEHMSLDELEANRENYKTPYNVGDKFTVGVNLGEQGFFDNGKCNSLTGDYASQSANCFKDTTMTVYDSDGRALYTTRSLPLSVGSSAFPEGTILPYTGDLAKIPKGWVLCDGSNGTPDLRGRFLEGTGTDTGQFKEAGLPNITGKFNAGHPYPNPDTGPFFPLARGITFGYGVYGASYYFGFDASRANPIYGKSETVQPSSFTVFYIMKTNKDFHYEHTNGFVSPEYYTKEEVDSLLKNERKKSDNTYLAENSKKYVRNDNTNYTLSMAYNSDDKKMHFYVDGEELFAQGENTPIEQFTDEGGYYKFPNGMIMQWGKIKDVYVYDLNGKKGPIGTFPIPFAHKCLNVTLSLYAPAEVDSGISNVYSHNITNNNFEVITDGYSHGLTHATINWLAIGY